MPPFFLRPELRLILTLTTLSTLQLVLGKTFQCTVEKFDSDQHCVFRNVNLGEHTFDVRFTYPADVPKPSQVTFVDSYMTELPSDFLTLAGSELKVLRVESCGLKLVTITSGLEALYAKGNSIENVIVHQSESEGSLRMLDLSENELSDFSNITMCQALEVLNLSGNMPEDVLDLGTFRGLKKLRVLDVSHNEINYLDNTGNVNLESLEDLDLSHNNILPSDLNIAIFYPYTMLHTLRLNNNLMSQLDYNHLLNIKPLKTVYLNGNNFKCAYLDSMLKHLQQNDMLTPPGEPASCPDKIFNDFCCTGPLPTNRTKPDPKPVHSLGQVPSKIAVPYEELSRAEEEVVYQPPASESVHDGTTESTPRPFPGLVTPEIKTLTERPSIDQFDERPVEDNRCVLVAVIVLVTIAVLVIAVILVKRCRSKSQPPNVDYESALTDPDHWHER